jgi:hypothetical protein
MYAHTTRLYAVNVHLEVVCVDATRTWFYILLPIR